MTPPASASVHAAPATAEPRLTPEQEAVVQADVHALAVTAGAGTGKTFTLAMRVRHLVRERRVPEHRVQVITFTREATATLQRRLNLLLGRGHQVDVRSFHSFAARALPPHARRFISEKEARPLMARAAATAFSRDPRGPILRRILSGGGLERDSMEQKLLTFWSYCKNCEITPRRAVETQFTMYAGFEDALTEVTTEYEALKSGVLDFDDVLITLRNSLRDDPAFLDEVAGRLDHLLVDEYQDVNGIQHDIVVLLAKPRRGRARPQVTVVGDARQSIYGFRGGAPDRLAAFTDAFPQRRRKRLHLSRNFRSHPGILRAANRLLPHGGARLTAPTGTPRGPAPRAIALPDAAEEARFVADEVEALLAAGEDAAGIAVLARSRHLMRALDEEITTRVGRAKRFQKRRATATAAADWLLTFARFLDPKFRLSRKTKAVVGHVLSPLVADASAVPQFVDEALALKARQAKGDRVSTPPGPNDAWRAFTSLRDARASVGRGFRGGAFPAEAVLAAATTLPFREGAFEDAVREIARRVARTPAASAADFSTAVTAALDADMVTDALLGVQRLTIHGAKGLEWDHVFLVGAFEGGLPSDPALGAPDAARDALLAEERRLAYVACTRPRKSFTATRPLGNGRRVFDASRFLEPLCGAA